MYRTRGSVYKHTVKLVIDVLTHTPSFKQVISLRSASLLHHKPGNTELGLETDSFSKNELI